MEVEWGHMTSSSGGAVTGGRPVPTSFGGRGALGGRSRRGVLVENQLRKEGENIDFFKSLSRLVKSTIGIWLFILIVVIR